MWCAANTCTPISTQQLAKINGLFALPQDTSRHFLSVSTLERIITAMSMAKMNALHFHIVDSDGWALCLDSLKHVCETQAYRDPFGTPAVYTPAQLHHIVKFATARGVRIIPEFDLPGHIARPLCAAEPSLK